MSSRRRELRNFGLTIGIAFGILGALFFWRGKGLGTPFLIASPILILIGLVAPRILAPLHRVWMAVATVMGWVMTRVILSLLFYLVVTPIGLLGRLKRGAFLDRGFRRDTDSYWVPVGGKDRDPSSYRKQY